MPVADTTRTSALRDDLASLPPGYRSARVIGRGASGVVCAAVQESTGRTVALKILDGGTDEGAVARRFERERRSMGELSHHPGIATLYDAGLHAGRPWIAMEYCSRCSFAVRTGPLSRDEAVALLHGVAAGLAISVTPTASPQYGEGGTTTSTTTRRTALMAWVERHGDGYRVRYRLNDDLVTENGYTTRDAAEDRAADIESDQRRGRFVDPRLAQTTIDEWIRSWTAAHVVSGITSATYDSHIPNHILLRSGLRASSSTC